MNAMLPSNYAALLNQFKANICQSRQRAAMAANLELLQLHPAFVQRPVAQLIWSHHFIVIDRLKEPRKREFYSHKALQHGWCRDTLSLQIKAELYQRQGKAITNFGERLSSPQSDLAQQLTKILICLIFSSQTASIRGD